jgi:hypothetical protein
VKVKSFILTAALYFLICTSAFAGFGDTLPQNLFLLDVSYLQSTVRSRWDANGNRGNLQEDINMYEPTGELQGSIVAPAENNMQVLLTTLFYGITDDFSIGLIFPFILRSKTTLNLGWESGDYNTGLGRSYTESDFWAWADSMGQGRPEDFEGTNMVGDLMIGSRLRLYRGDGNQVSMMAYVDTRTGEDADPEILGSAGATGYAMGTNGDLGLFMSYDKYWDDGFWKRLTLSINLFYEYSHWRTMDTSRGDREPLLLSYADYVGKHYRVKPYDYWGGTLGFNVALAYGPTATTWLTEGNPEMQAGLPAMWSMAASWNHKRYNPMDFRSNSAEWDSDQEAVNGAGFKNTISIRTDVNFMRLGAPVALYLKYDNQEWLVSQNLRPVVSKAVGLQLFFTF